MKRFNKETIIGLVSIVSLIGLYFGVNYLKGINLFHPTNFYYVAFDNINDLKVQNAVYVEGYKVGFVNDLHYNYDAVGGKVLAVLDLDKKLKIPSGSKAELKVSLLGTASIDLHFNQYVSTYYHKGDTLEGFSEVGLMAQMGETMLPALERTLPRIDTILWTLQTILSSPAFSHTLQHIENTTAYLESSSQQLNTIMKKDIPPLLDNLKELSGKINRMDFEATYALINNTLKDVNKMTQMLNSKQGTVGLLLNDTQLYDNLSNLTAQADSLVRDLKAHPKRYVHFSVFGKKDK